MDNYSGKIKRCLGRRKFNLSNEAYCCTGGSRNGCPFFKLSGVLKWVCTLYRLAPKSCKLDCGYARVIPCMNNEAPPVKNRYNVTSGTKSVVVVAISEEEAMAIYKRKYKSRISAIQKGEVLEYEYVV